MPCWRINEIILDEAHIFSWGEDSRLTLASVLDALSPAVARDAVESLARQWRRYYTDVLLPLREERIGAAGGKIDEMSVGEQEMLALRIGWCDRAKTYLEGYWAEPFVYHVLAEAAIDHGIQPDEVVLDASSGLNLQMCCDEEVALFLDYASVYHEAHVVFDTDLFKERDKRIIQSTKTERRELMGAPLRDAVMPLRSERRQIHGDRMQCDLDERYTRRFVRDLEAYAASIG